MHRCRIASIVLAMLAAGGPSAFGQSFGVELHNTLMPASGGMGGVSIARPQDLTSAINGNPATLTQFRGTQFMFGGGWAEPTFNMTQTSDIPVGGPSPRIEPFSAKSTAPGIPAGNIGLTQDLSELGMPATFAMGFITTAGGFVDFRHVPESHGTNTGQTIFNMPLALGVDLTERLSAGASLSLGIAFFDGPFVVVGGMTPACALRGTVGANYLLTDATTVGAYYQTEQSYRFPNAFVLNPGPGQTAVDVRSDLPQNIGLGVANTTLLDGRSACPDKCLVGGTNAMLWLRPAGEIIAQIEADLDSLPHHRGIVVTSAGVMPPLCGPETIKQVCEWVRQYPARMN